MKKLLTVLTLFVCASAYGQDPDFKTYYSKAIEAYRSKSYQQFYELISKANTLHPYHQGILYQLGLAAALTGHTSEAIENLKKALAIDNSFKLELNDFNSISGNAAFKRLVAQQKESRIPVIHSDTALVIKDRALHVEGIAFDASRNIFFAGSIHKRKIIQVKDGVVSDFCPPAFNGMTSVFGLAIDVERKFLWACSSPMREMENYDSTARSAVFKFDLISGKLIEKYMQPKFERDAVFGDLVIGKNGQVFVSDGQTNTIFTIDEKTKKLVPWFTNEEFWNMQGLTFSDDGAQLFVSDYIKGIFRIDVGSKAVVSITAPEGLTLKGIDGLMWYKQSLIAIQNGVDPLRVTRLYLNPSKDKIINSELIDSAHPAFGEPTLGVVSDDTLYYIANSQWEGYDRERHILPVEKLHDIVILKSSLKK